MRANAKTERCFGPLSGFKEALWLNLGVNGVNISFCSTERAFVDTVPEEDRRRDLARYVSAELTFVETDSEDDFEIRLPEQNLPDGFQLSKIRCSKRALYGFMPGFKIVLSKEISRDIKTRSRVSVSELLKDLFSLK